MANMRRTQQTGCTRQARSEVQPADHGEERVREVVRPEEALRREQVRQDVQRFPGPPEKRTRLRKLVRLPFTARVKIAMSCSARITSLY